MTLLGKIFTVLIFIQSLVFMAFAIGVYATHTNWRDVVMRTQEKVGQDTPLGLKYQLENEKERYDRLVEEKRDVGDELAEEKAARRQALATLESRVRQLNGRLEDAVRDNAELVQSERLALAAVEATQKNVVRIKDEVADLRGQYKTISADRDDQFQRVATLTDTVHESRTIRARMQERQGQLATELAKRKEVMDRHGISPDEPPENTPPEVDGVVTATSKSGLVEISIGSDDGIREGHQLEVFSGSKYLGRIRIRKTSPDRAVGEIDKKFEKGPVKKGDRVATRLSS